MNDQSIFQSYIGNNQIDEAILMLQDVDIQFFIQTRARWTRLKTNMRYGTITSSYYDVEYNKIVQALLSKTALLNGQKTANNMASIENQLLQIAAHYTRRDKGIADEALEILSKIRGYNDKKAITPTFDPKGKEKEILHQYARKFSEKVKNKEEESSINVIKKVDDLLSDRLPRWENIKKAYDLAMAKGMENDWIDEMFARQPDDVDAKIKCVESIEAFIATIK
jgi:hypothetical protein